MTAATHKPKLRFQPFVDLWVTQPVGCICESIVPGRNKPKDFSGDIPWITTPDIQHFGGIYKSASELAISEQEAKEVGSKIVPKNSIVISCVGDLGLVAIAGTKLVINQQLHAFLPSEFVKPRFLLYSLSMRNRYINKVATKTAVPYMNKDNCNSIPVIYPSLPEQQKIADFLTAVDTRIEQLTQKKALLENYKKGVMQQLFSQAIRFKDDDGGEYPDWEENKLRQVGDIVTGGTPSTLDRSLYGGDYLFVSPADISDSRRIKSTVKKLSLKGHHKGRLIPEGGCLFVCIGSTIGKVSQAGEDCTTNQQINSIIPNSAHKSDFIYFLLAHHSTRIKMLAATQAVPIINKSVFSDYDVLTPSLDEQTKIANFLVAIDQKIETLGTQITETKTFKKGLLQQMFV